MFHYTVFDTVNVNFSWVINFADNTLACTDEIFAYEKWTLCENDYNSSSGHIMFVVMYVSFVQHFQSVL